MEEPKRSSDEDVLRGLETLVKKREHVFALATAIFNNAKKLTARHAEGFKIQLKHLERLENEFASIQNEIITMNSKLGDSKGSVETTQVSLNFYEIVWATQTKAQQCEVSIDGGAAAPPATPAVPLVPMQVPKFDGTVSMWTEFKSLFDQLIHENTSLNAVQKFYYLKTLVIGDAAKIISNLDISAANYPIAYDALVKRYASKRRLANRCVSEILNFQRLGKESEFLSIHENAVNSLKAMRLPDLADYVLFRICYENLTPRMRYLFDDRCDSQNVPTCQELFDFVLHHTQNSELRNDAQGATKQPPRFKNIHPSKPQLPKAFLNKINNHDKVGESTSKGPKTVSCPMCKGTHLIYSCPDFLKLRVSERRDTIINLERCLNCLGQHNLKKCRSQNTCTKCNQKHHTFLHTDTDSGVSEGFPSESPPRCHFLSDTSSVVILGTFVAQIQDHQGEYHEIRCVMDPGSHVSAISTRLARKLGHKSQRVECSVSGLGNSTTSSKEKLEVRLRSCVTRQTSLHFSAYVFPQICHQLPSKRITPRSDLHHLQGLQLADPSYDTPGPVDLLLSAEMSAAILSKETPNLIVGEPTAIRTLFGWILYGSVPVVSPHPKGNEQTLFALQKQLQKFWEIEENPPTSFTSPEEDWCESHFLKTHSRDDTGRYTVALPFRPDRPPIGSNREYAMKRWLRLEKRLMTSNELRQSYNEVLQDYLDQKQMEVASSSSNYILPHHAVTKISSTTKLRVVFDASARDSSGLSLNDRLWPGPKLQKDIAHIISSFRSFRYALCGDISQMYRRIWLHPSDRHYQHIFWRETPQTDVMEFELCTLTFGLASAPFLAQRVLHQLVQDEGSQYELASSALKHHTYIDDIITGVHSLEEGKKLQNQLIELLSKGGFYLRKWCSNAPELLQDVPPGDLEKPLEFRDGSQGLKVLGLFWNPNSDFFTYQVQPFTGRITKRTILSFTSRIYDPLGWLAPVIIVAKCFMQKLWLLKLDWDSDLPRQLREEWSSFSSQFGNLCQIQIPRQLNPYQGRSHHRYNLIGFCDASETAYAACVYLQILDLVDSPLMLLQAKTKVAPLKSMTIPCLELCGALLLIRLFKSMTCPYPIHQTFFFTDSQIVLSWLRIPLHRLKIFVANRVAEILENSDLTQWRHIPGKLNPADLASRGLQPENLLRNTLWWNGPEKLPDQVDLPTLPIMTLPEIKPVQEGKLLLILNSTNAVMEFFERFSSWIRLQRVVAWIFRFYHNCRSPNSRCKKAWLSVEEHNSAKQRIILLTQNHYFSDAIRDLKHKQIPRSLLSLQPFLDQSGCLRVGGRLRHSQLNFNSKHPLLVPGSSHVAKLIVRHYHEISLHSGPSTVQSIIQKEYWIPSLRNLLRWHIFRCIPCHRLKGSVQQPKMGDLPAERVTVSRPFSRTATDFAGPFLVKESSRRHARSTKCYLCVFICMAIKAVHLEVVTSLSTEAFLAAFTRFINRRGLPSVILSDNGRNFLGASRELKELQKWLTDNEDQIGSSLATRSIRWKFNPPEAPNFGGLFEAAVKSAKTLMYRMIGNQPFTLEELATLFCRIEGILNSRPITRLSSDPTEDYLSPAHFLVGGVLHQLPEEPLEEPPLGSRWKRVQQLGQAFWKKWSTQYLQQIIGRPKWTKTSPPLQVGDLVYVKGHTTLPLSWPMGRVTETFPGSDGIVRVVSVRTNSGSYIRPVNKLIPLPMEK